MVPFSFFWHARRSINVSISTTWQALDKSVSKTVNLKSLIGDVDSFLLDCFVHAASPLHADA